MIMNNNMVSERHRFQDHGCHATSFYSPSEKLRKAAFKSPFDNVCLRF